MNEDERLYPRDPNTDFSNETYCDRRISYEEYAYYRNKEKEKDSDFNNDILNEHHAWLVFLRNNINDGKNK